MKAYIRFIKEHYSGVGFGGMLTFFSSFGQTFLISLYIPEFVKTFGLTEGAFGNIYAVCTVTASFFMLSVGHTIDHYPVRRVTFLTISGLAASLLLLAGSFHQALLFLSITGLRLTGQGLMGHISQTVVSRYFSKNRGKALSVSSLGFSVGEAVFPVIIVLLINNLGWRLTAIVSAGILVLFLISLAFMYLGKFDKHEEEKSGVKKQPFTDYLNFLKEKRFYVLAPAIFVLPFTMTGIFFYQYVIAENKGWDATLYAAFFTGFAASRFIFSLMGGLWVDKYSSLLMYRIYLLPLLIGIVPLALFDHIIGALVFLILSGASMGMSGPVKSALIAELYGTDKLGTIRSLFTMFMVISTALGPLLVGNLMDADVSLLTILGIVLGLVAVAVLNAQRITGFAKAE